MLNHSKKTWLLFLGGAAFYWLSLPPMKFPWAAYLSIACWVAIVARRCAPTKKEYWSLWLTGLLMWLAILQGIRLASWPLYIGWAALSMYVASYLPLFIVMARWLRHSKKIPLSISCAVAWIACEWCRAHVATGFTAGLLAHSQAPWPSILPIASHFGSYGVSFFVVLGGSLIHESAALMAFQRSAVRPKQKTTHATKKWRKTQTKTEQVVAIESPSKWSITILTIAIIGIAGCAAWSLAERDRTLLEPSAMKPLARILLIQDDMKINLKADHNQTRQALTRYSEQTNLAAKKLGRAAIDLVVWPENTFDTGVAWLDWDKSLDLPADFVGDVTKYQAAIHAADVTAKTKLKSLFSLFGTVKPQFILGTNILKIRSGITSVFNGALWARTENEGDTSYYAKQHLVMFGEYIPLISRFPFILKWMGLGKYEPGLEPSSWKLPNGVTISPSICFENFLPHLIQAQVQKLTAAGMSPEILVNITNDAWFSGSSMLDHHLNSAIFGAVENRRPMLVAGNQGISAWIDGDGRVIQSLPPFSTGSILAEPIADGRWGLWQVTGDYPEMILTILIALFFLRDLIRRRVTSVQHPNAPDCDQ
jgi:apolipoprotein N-acyltransferase